MPICAREAKKTAAGHGNVSERARETAPQLLRAGVRHQLTHRTLLVDFYLWEPAAEPALPEGYFWIEEAELDRYAKPRLFELLLEALPEDGASGQGQDTNS